MQITVHLNKAAYMILRGAELVRFEGKYANNCKVVVEISKETMDSIYKDNNYSLNDYRDYMKERSKIKLKIKKVYRIL